MPIRTDSDRLVDTLKYEHADAIKKGNFGKANITRAKLELAGEDGDFETSHDPEQLR